MTPRGPASYSEGSVNAPVTIGGREVKPGDLVLGDDDGLVSLSPEQARQYLEKAQAKLALEAEWIASFTSGRTVGQTFALPPAKTV